MLVEWNIIIRCTAISLSQGVIHIFDLPAIFFLSILSGYTMNEMLVFDRYSGSRMPVDRYSRVHTYSSYSDTLSETSAMPYSHHTEMYLKPKQDKRR